MDKFHERLTAPLPIAKESQRGKLRRRRVNNKRTRKHTIVIGFNHQSIFFAMCLCCLVKQASGPVAYLKRTVTGFWVDSEEE